jgi:hypothetical protein
MPSLLTCCTIFQTPSCSVSRADQTELVKFLVDHADDVRFNRDRGTTLADDAFPAFSSRSPMPAFLNTSRRSRSNSRGGDLRGGDLARLEANSSTTVGLQLLVKNCPSSLRKPTPTCTPYSTRRATRSKFQGERPSRFSHRKPCFVRNISVLLAQLIHQREGERKAGYLRSGIGGPGERDRIVGPRGAGSPVQIENRNGSQCPVLFNIFGYKISV